MTVEMEDTWTSLIGLYKCHLAKSCGKQELNLMYTHQGKCEAEGKA